MRNPQPSVLPFGGSTGLLASQPACLLQTQDFIATGSQKDSHAQWTIGFCFAR